MGEFDVRQGDIDLPCVISNPRHMTRYLPKITDTVEPACKVNVLSNEN